MTRSLAPALEDYRRATGDFIAGTSRVPAARWSLPRATGKWSPAEESEHITLAHEIFAQQLGGGAPVRVVITGWRRRALRWIVLPWILRTGRFPRGRSPREARPSAAAVPQDVLAARLGAAAAAIVSDLEQRGPAAFRQRIDHPYFGALTLAQLLRLTTVHTRHHLVTLSMSGASVA